MSGAASITAVSSALAPADEVRLRAHRVDARSHQRGVGRSPPTAQPRVHRRVRPQRQPVHGDAAAVDPDHGLGAGEPHERAAAAPMVRVRPRIGTSRAASRRARSRRASPRGSRCSLGRHRRGGPHAGARPRHPSAAPAGFRSASSSSPPRRSSRPHRPHVHRLAVVARSTSRRSRRSDTGTSIARQRDGAPAIGFMHDRANATRSGSPADASSAPDASHTATSPRCTDSTTPERTTCTIGTDIEAAGRAAFRTASGRRRPVEPEHLGSVVDEVEEDLDDVGVELRAGAERDLVDRSLDA